MEEIELTITVDEANTILEALGNLPFKEVFTLVSKIQKQASQQLGKASAAGESASEETPDAG